MEQHLGWIQLSISIVMDVQWKIHVHGLHSCLCANGDPKVLWWNWTKFMYEFIKLPKRTNYFYVAQ